jgi:hypothetical protein
MKPRNVILLLEMESDIPIKKLRKMARVSSLGIVRHAQAEVLKYGLGIKSARAR